MHHLAKLFPMHQLAKLFPMHQLAKLFPMHQLAKLFPMHQLLRFAAIVTQIVPPLELSAAFRPDNDADSTGSGTICCILPQY